MRKQEQEKPSQTLKVVISGSYRVASKQIESFDNIEGLMPYLDHDKATQMAIRRYAKIWVSQAKDKDGNAKYKHIDKVRQVFIDSIEDNEENPDAVLSYVGKDIMEMNYEELQDLAAANDLNGVPLYKTGSLATARRIAFSEYAIKVLELEEYARTDKQEKFNLYDHRTTGFNPKQFEPIIADDEIRRFDGHQTDIEEGIEVEAKNTKRKGGKAVDEPKSTLTMTQLKRIAETRNVMFNKGISFEALYKKVYGKARAA